MTARNPIADLNARIKARAAMNNAAQQENKARAVSTGAGLPASDSIGADFKVTDSLGSVPSRGLPNNPAAAAPSKYSDECDALTSLVERFFEERNGFCVDTCPYYREASDLCECLEDGCVEVCPKADDLIDEDCRRNQAEAEADRCR